MTMDEALTEWVVPAIRRTWNEKRCKEILAALEQEPCDAVSRKAAIDACLKGLNMKEMVTNIKALSSVTPAEKVGQWIVHEKPHGIRYLECPYCNIWYLNEHLIRNSYCPNCGTKMEEVEE